MSPRVDLLGPLEDLAAALTGAGVNAAVNVGDVKAPGVWVVAGPVSLDRLGGYTIHARLLCIVEDGDNVNTLTALTDLANDVLALVDADDDLTPVTVQPEWSEAPLPALSIPHDLLCDYLPEEEETP